MHMKSFLRRWLGGMKMLSLAGLLFSVGGVAGSSLAADKTPDPAPASKAKAPPAKAKTPAKPTQYTLKCGNGATAKDNPKIFLLGNHPGGNAKFDNQNTCAAGNGQIIFQNQCASALTVSFSGGTPVVGGSTSVTVPGRNQQSVNITDDRGSYTMTMYKCLSNGTVSSQDTVTGSLDVVPSGELP